MSFEKAPYCLKLNAESLLKQLIPLPRKKNVKENEKESLATFLESLPETE